MMDANEYQQLAARTLIDKPDRMPTELQFQLLWNALQQSIHSGVLVERLKKSICHQQDNIDEQQIVARLEEESCDDLNIPPPATEDSYMLVWNLLGLVGEVSELVDECMAAMANGKMPDATLITKEAGDCEWYLNAIATKLGIKMSDVLEHNVAKLKARYPEGYSAERSSNREGLAS
jgi:NTP pyrophosphatase (non-canonical NTP hydrolase)